MAASYNLVCIMIWEIAQDYRGDCQPSLLDTIAANVPRVSEATTGGGGAEITSKYIFYVCVNSIAGDMGSASVTQISLFIYIVLFVLLFK
jgi:hypothetical protein